MTFLAGIVSLEKPINTNTKNQFLKGLEVAEGRLPWNININAKYHYILAQAGFSEMWQGPKMITNSDYDAVATGVQWRKIPHCKEAIEYLKKVVCGEEILGDYFDYFSCAFIFIDSGEVILVNDPTIISPVFYLQNDGMLVFSSHQSFLNEYLGNSNDYNRQAVLEYLIIGHTIGEKSLLKNVKILNSGSMLKYTRDRCEITSYSGFDGVDIDEKMSLNDATELIFNEMRIKFNEYETLTDKNFCALLSGGWDSRLIVALMAAGERLESTYTTQQQMNRIDNILISEGKIAEEVVKYLKINNEFIQNSSLDFSTLIKSLWEMDFLTWFGLWGLNLINAIPYDKFVIVDGIAGDLFLRGSRIDDILFQTIQKGDREKAIEIIHANYLKGLHYFTPGFESWKGIIKDSYLENFSEELKQDISKQIRSIKSQNFIVPFFAVNRIRKGTSIYQRLLLGTKGAVAMPFCSLNLAKKSLSIPIEYMVDHSLYKSLLEKSKPGLSQIVSTNSHSIDELKEYLIYPASKNWFVQKAKDTIRQYLPNLFRLMKTAKNRKYDSGMINIETYIKENSMENFYEILAPEIVNAIQLGKSEEIFKNKNFLEKILPLNEFITREKTNFKYI